MVTADPALTVLFDVIANKWKQSLMRAALLMFLFVLAALSKDDCTRLQQE